MAKVQPPIVANFKLKNEIIDELIEELNVNEELINKHLELFMEYAFIKIELQQYVSTIPYDELDRYKKLKHLKAEFFLKLEKLLNKEITKS